MAKELNVKVNFPGLLKERLPSGNFRYRVRVEGRGRKRIRLHVAPDHPSFIEHYHAARAGVELQPEAEPVDNTIRGSIAWLTYRYLDALETRVSQGLAAEGTLKIRQLMLRKVRQRCGEYAIDMPTSEVVKIRDEMAHTPAAADNTVKAISAMYRWASDNGICDINPAAGVSRIDKGAGGAVPWSADDLRAFREAHPPGTNAYLCLTILMFTACRIGDVARLGRNNEFSFQGDTWLGWQPAKRGSAYVEIPMMPQLYRATRISKIIGPTYLLTANGESYRSGDALGQHLRKWCRQAGLENRSAHGIRKAAGNLLAEEGATQYQIMSIHGHTRAQTSEIYTKGVERRRMAKEAMSALGGIEW